jgi:hypothetical protein
MCKKIMKKIETELINPTVERDSEKVHRSTRAALSGVPVPGGALTEAFSALIEPPMAKRKTEWMVQVSDAIKVHQKD